MYRIIEAEKANFTIVRMTGLLEVSRSGFYKWRTARAAGPTPAQQRREAIDVKVKGFHDASDQVYGAPRILADLREDGEVIFCKTVAASMRRQRLAGISPRKFTSVTTVVDLDAHRPKDLVNRRFDRGELNKVWTSDITYLPTGAAWLYLCAVRGRVLAAGPGLGSRGPHAHRSGGVRTVDGSGAAWGLARTGHLPR